MTMKDSGIAWIGEIPKDWRVIKLGYIFLEHNLKNKNNKENNLLSLSYGKIIRKNIETRDGLLPANFLSYNIINKEDIVLRLTDLQNDQKSLRVGLVNEQGIITSAYITLRLKVDYIASYFYYLLYTYDVIKVFYNMGSGVRQGLNFDELSKLLLIVPSKAEQYQIADFLWKQCSKIDSVIDKAKQTIAKLEEYKKSLITQAVTKGLDPNVEMKDSGIPWIGMIPSHWNIGKLKFYLKRSEPRNPGDKQVLSLYREYGVIPKDSRDDNHNVTSEDTSKYKYVKSGNFVINKMKAWQGSVAVSNYEGIVSPAYYVYKFTNEAINKRYFHYLLRSSYKDEFKRISAGIRIGQWDLSSDDLDRTMILIPPLSEQQQIADVLDKNSLIIEKLIFQKNALIEKLEEYKKSLIFEYVTGKKTVGEN